VQDCGHDRSPCVEVELDKRAAVCGHVMAPLLGPVHNQYTRGPLTALNHRYPSMTMLEQYQQPSATGHRSAPTIAIRRSLWSLALGFGPSGWVLRTEDHPNAVGQRPSWCRSLLVTDRASAGGSGHRRSGDSWRVCCHAVRGRFGSKRESLTCLRGVISG
jgi:hypothetical protein